MITQYQCLARPFLFAFICGSVLICQSGCDTGLITEADRTENIVTANDNTTPEGRSGAKVSDAPEGDAESHSNDTSTTEAAPQSEPDVLYSDDAFRDAAMKGNIKVVRLALESGTDVNSAGPQGRIALQLAAFDGHTELVELLLKEGSNIDHLDSFGRSALMYASTGPNVETVKLLLKSKAKIDLVDNNEGFSALMFAAAENQKDVVQLLLDANANTELKDIDGDTAQSFAAKNGHTEVAEMLEKARKPTKQ